MGCHQPFTARRGNQESFRSSQTSGDAFGLLVLHSDLVYLLIMEPDCHHMLTAHSDPLILLQLTNHPDTLRHLPHKTPTLTLDYRLRKACIPLSPYRENMLQVGPDDKPRGQMTSHHKISYSAKQAEGTPGHMGCSSL